MPFDKSSRDHPLIPWQWTDEDWHLEIQHDRFDEAEPWVVSIAVRHSDKIVFDALATPTPTQAREMAAALLVYAHFAEQENAKG